MDYKSWELTKNVRIPVSMKTKYPHFSRYGNKQLKPAVFIQIVHELGL